MEYTQGDWKVEGDCYIIAGEEHKHSLIADIATANDDYEANANLIAAAPDLYEALKDILLLHNVDFELLHRGVGTVTTSGKRLLEAERAIAKAQGKV